VAQPDDEGDAHAADRHAGQGDDGVAEEDAGLITTTPSAGRVSSPENGGARKATRLKPNTASP
jgi:hypothetical protein